MKIQCRIISNHVSKPGNWQYVTASEALSIYASRAYDWQAEDLARLTAKYSPFWEFRVEPEQAQQEEASHD